MYEPARFRAETLPLLWPAMAAASAGDMAMVLARRLADWAVGPDTPPAAEPQWATPHRIALELKSVRLRDFATTMEGPATILCAPLALHGAALADFAPGHSLLQTLRRAGVARLFVVDWRSASPEMRFRGIDDYLADLNVLVDQVGAPIDLVGLCQGGWMALVYAARFPAKVRKLVLAGAPVDTAAEPSALSAAVAATPLPLFHELVRLGDGLVPGRRVLKFWGPENVDPEEIRRLLESEQPVGSPGFAALEASFRAWYAWTVDLPGAFFLECVERLYKQNALARGEFVALGRRIALAALDLPIFMAAAGEDELVAPAQLFAAARLVGTAAHDLQKITVPGRHVSLFMGKQVLDNTWPRIARWITDPALPKPDLKQRSAA